MAIRDTILANVTTALSGSSIGISSELPWVTGATPLYEKNMKKFYLSEATTNITELLPTLDRNDVFQKETLLTGYITVDAKNQPSDIASVVSKVLLSRQSVSNTFVNECNAVSDIDDDRITYTFEYKFVEIN